MVSSCSEEIGYNLKEKCGFELFEEITESIHMYNSPKLPLVV